MYKWSHNSSLKSCGTCEYWAGQRRPMSLNTRVEGDDIQQYPCMHLKCRGSKRSYNSQCVDYKKWAVLK